MIKSSAISTSLIVLLSTGLLLACGRTPTASDSGTAKASDPKQEKPDKVLQPFESLPGTPYLVANIVQQGEEKSRSLISSESYRSDAGAIRNLVFLDSGSLESHPLFETNEYTILEAQQYPLQDADTEKTKKTARFVYQVVKEDTNQDQYLGSGDHRIIALSDAFGKQYVEVLTDISQLLNLQLLSSNRMLAVYVKNEKKTASIIDLEQRVVVKTNAIADLGPEIR